MKDFWFTFLAWILTLPFLAATLIFALYNNESVSVTYSPFRDPLSLPVYVPVLFAIGFGFLFGAIMTWAAMGRLRAKTRAQAKHIKLLEKQLQDVKSPAPVTHNYATTPLKLLGRK
jgi:uncharacterized integral membrane protein